jgi:hypothetical protein
VLKRTRSTCPPIRNLHRCGHVQAADTFGVRNDDVMRFDEELPGDVQHSALHVDESLQATPEVETKWGEIGKPRQPKTEPRPPTLWLGNYRCSHNLRRMLWLTVGSSCLDQVWNFPFAIKTVEEFLFWACSSVVLWQCLPSTKKGSAWCGSSKCIQIILTCFSILMRHPL